MTNYELTKMLENNLIRDLRRGNAVLHKEIEKRMQAFFQEINVLRIKGEAFPA